MASILALSIIAYRRLGLTIPKVLLVADRRGFLYSELANVPFSGEECALSDNSSLIRLFDSDSSMIFGEPNSHLVAITRFSERDSTSVFGQPESIVPELFGS